MPDPVPGPVPDTALSLPPAVSVAPRILAAVADRLPEDPARPEIWPVITGAVADHCRRQVQLGGQVPASGQTDELAQAVFDLRYGLGPLAPHLRENGVENIDINGCEQRFTDLATARPLLCLPDHRLTLGPASSWVHGSAR